MILFFLDIVAMLVIVMAMAVLGQRCIDYLFPPPPKANRRRHNQAPRGSPRRRISDVQPSTNPAKER